MLKTVEEKVSNLSSSANLGAENFITKNNDKTLQLIFLFFSIQVQIHQASTYILY